MSKPRGKVWLVGAGPGDPGLLTIKGMQTLQNADVVVYDRLIGTEILNFIPLSARKINVGKRAQHHIVPQEQINQILLTEALEGQNVVRLKGGDPFLFGRGSEELVLLKEHNIPFEIVPGITSAIAVPAYAGIPVTHRNSSSSLHIISGHAKNDQVPSIEYESLVKLPGTLVFLMSVATHERISSGLLAAGMSEHISCAVIEQGTTARQRTILTTLGGISQTIRLHAIKAPMILVVGEVCKLSECYSWMDKRPLNGVRIIVTRPQEGNSILSEKIRAFGGEAIELPCISISSIEPNPALQTALSQLDGFHWLVFTSPMGAKLFFSKLFACGKDIRFLSSIKIAVIGSATRDVFLQRGIFPDFMPTEYHSAMLGSELLPLLGKDERVLILRAKDGLPQLTQALSAQQVNFTDLPLYETFDTGGNFEFSMELVNGGDFDFVTFTSPSTVNGFVHLFPELNFENIQAVCIGGQTEQEAKKVGMKTITAKKSTLDSLVEAIIDTKDEWKWNS